MKLVTCILSQSVSEVDLVAVCRNPKPQHVCNVDRSSRAGLPFETSEVGLDIIIVHLEFGLMGKGDILYAVFLCTTEDHDPERLVVDTSLEK